jgi:hypothetical protein
MKFGPAEMAQTMVAAKALITVILVSSVSIGIVLGLIVAFFRHRAADQSFQSGMPTVPSLPTVPAQEIDPTAPVFPRPNNLLSARTPRLIALLLVITILIEIAGGGFWYYTSKRSDFEATKNGPGIQPLPSTREPQVPSDFEATYKQLGIQPLPLTVERQEQIQSRLAQLSREACYTDAIVALGRALLNAGFPREAAIKAVPAHMET